MLRGGHLGGQWGQEWGPNPPIAGWGGGGHPAAPYGPPHLQLFLRAFTVIFFLFFFSLFFLFLLLLGGSLLQGGLGVGRGGLGLALHMVVGVQGGWIRLCPSPPCLSFPIPTSHSTYPNVGGSKASPYQNPGAPPPPPKAWTPLPDPPGAGSGA